MMRAHLTAFALLAALQCPDYDQRPPDEEEIVEPGDVDPLDEDGDGGEGGGGGGVGGDGDSEGDGDGDGDGGGDDEEDDRQGAGFPGSGRDGHGTVAILYVSRVERSTTLLAESYESLGGAIRLALEQNGFDVSGEGIVDLSDGALFWSVDEHSASSYMADAYAQRAAGVEGFVDIDCTTDGLIAVGPGLPWESTHGAVPFGGAAEVLLIVFLDSGARPVAPDHARCLTGQQPPATVLGAGEQPAWLTLGGAQQPPTWSSLRYLFLSTPEGNESSTAMRARCSELGLDDALLDALEPSPTSFYGPLSFALESGWGRWARGYDLCEALHEDFDDVLDGIASDWALTLGSE